MMMTTYPLERETKVCFLPVIHQPPLAVGSSSQVAT